jgi:hypothetical protein
MLMPSRPARAAGKIFRTGSMKSSGFVSEGL